MQKLKIGDSVKIMIGKDKGREGKIEKIYPARGLALIPEINIYKKHVKSAGELKGGVYDLPRPISLAKIALLCPKCKKITRVGFKFVDNKKLRICKKCKREI